MSASVNVASLTIPQLPVFYFAIAITPWGFIPDTYLYQQETLEDKGADYTRWRDMRLTYEPFPMITLEDDATYQAGQQRLYAYRNARSKTGTLVYSAGGVTGTYANVKVLDVGPSPSDPHPNPQVLHAGSLYGPAASSPSGCTLLAQWMLQLTQPGS